MHRFLATIMMACYAILAVLATAPHPHDLKAATRHSATERTLQRAPAVPPDTGSDDPDRPGHCSLCSFSRVSARPAPATFIHVADLSPVTQRLAPDPVPASAPQSHSFLLRAPPAA